MEYRMEMRKPFKVAGLKMRFNDYETNFSGLWDKLFDQVDLEKLEALGSGQSYGLSFRDDESMIYIAGFDVTDFKKANDLGLEVIEVPEAEYAVVSLEGAIPQSIFDGWKFVRKEIFDKQGYQHVGSPDFELYFDGDMQAKDYQMELWVPVTKTQY